MNEILLTPHIPSDADLERLNLFPGRHMGEDEFERQQAYVDRRLSTLMSAMPRGIIHGLEVRASQVDNQAGLLVREGLAIGGNRQALGLFYPLHQSWQQLIEDYQADNLTEDPAGLFYLTLERKTRYVSEDLSAHPDQRTEFDPTRDAQRLVVGTLGLFRLAINVDIAAGLPREQVENTIAAMHVDMDFMDSLGHAVPLGLVFIDNLERATPNPPRYGVRWFSSAAGRYMAVAEGGFQVLRNQAQEAFARLLAEARTQDVLTHGQYLEQQLKLDFLPAAGELPIALLRNLHSRHTSSLPGIHWLPRHLAADIVPVPEESVPALLDQHLSRRLVDLRQASGERLRLLLAVNEPDYKPDLLDVPQIDHTLAADIYRYFMRAYDIWAEWRRQFDRLYHLPELAKKHLDPAAIKVLDLPKPLAYPQLPAAFFEQVIQKSRTEVGAMPGGLLHYPYDQGVPAEPAFYASWRGRWLARAEDETDPRSFPEHDNPDAPTGLIIEYTDAQVDLDSLDTKIRIQRSRLERTRDYLLLQRQQLDSQTVALAALAGGVAGDGSGLQVARWLPFTQLKAEKTLLEDEPEQPSPEPITPPSTQPPSTQPAQPIAPMLLPDTVKLFTTLPLFKTVSTSAIPLKANTSIASTAQNLVSKTAIAKASNNLVFSSALRRTPTIFAPLQFNLNNSRLDKIAEAPRQALTKPAFDTKEFRFGVMEHIRPEIQEYKKCYRGITELLNTLKGLFDKNEAATLYRKLVSYGMPKTFDQVEAEAKKELQEDLTKKYPPIEKLATENASQRAEREAAEAARLAKFNKEFAALIYGRVVSQLYEELFNTGKILTGQIAWMESRYEQLEAVLQGLLRARIAKEDEIEKLAAQIRVATEQLTAIDRRRVEFLGDYGVAQRLLDDDWLDVYKLDQERTRVLTQGVRGLYFVRASQAFVGEPLADPLLLRYGKARDIVPGCDSDIDPDLPDELDDFFETVLEIPMAAWGDLQDFKLYLPEPEKLSYMETLRRLRLTEKTQRHNQISAQSLGQQRITIKPVATSAVAVRNENPLNRSSFNSTLIKQQAKPLASKITPASVTPAAVSLFGIRQQSQATLYQLAQLVIPAALPSARVRQQDAAEVVALADLLSTTKGALQKQAQQLHNRLEQAVWCMLEKLNELPPSLRLDWAQLAEDDRLPVEEVARWPGLERAERDDFNATRTLAEIVAWWFKQLDGDATATARAAMRNMVRATLIHASMGDPNEILQGNVQMPPRRFIPGELLRLQLNRTPRTGTLLQLLNPQQQVVALLNVDDHDERGTVARITQLTQDLPGNLQLTTQFRVVASKSTGQFAQLKQSTHVLK
ncbi:hypothetical protein [Cellvibrio japonicus]|uniref:Uncharacterized protein n=1 Tax=Cellvibrio japonicus (strain Ueda107) TaxID=498211 RepID=B3PD82_CELJU|nr:hypothetical protein [Cellvibrio japonicus]ACE84236.1 hypothetical protein CJA_3040 [Cellvibrio japonicus Ueda107]QEI13345.1 hypothetical protein FY117_14670 [Cellvibrio japonicus]QEI16919.1 hypothetical protein FY116_14675 [Cellvibrio japonicus]QEI20497.1 hypothetical protein FY115_14670 [Cellvibrio japonicus]